MPGKRRRRAGVLSCGVREQHSHPPADARGELSMFIHRKQFLRPIRVLNPNPRWAQLIIEQYGGSDSEASAFGNYLTQRFNTSRPELRDLLTDIGTEEISHWEMVGELVRQNGATLKFHNSAGTPWTAAYTTISGDILTDLWSDVGAELRARELYLRLLNQIDDAGARDTLLFLAAREEAHAVSFLKAIETIQGTLSLPATWYQHPYLNSSEGTYQEAQQQVPPAPPPLTYPPAWPYPGAVPMQPPPGAQVMGFQPLPGVKPGALAVPPGATGLRPGAETAPGAQMEARRDDGSPAG